MEDVKVVGLTALLVYLAAVYCLGVFSISYPDVRPGRLRWSNEAFFSYVPRTLYRFLVFSTAVFVTLSIALPTSVRIASVLAFGLWTLVAILALIYAKLKYPIGNNKATRIGGYVTYFLTLVLSVVALVFLSTQLPAPVGEAGTAPYILAGLIIVTVCLGENLISMLAPSRLLSNLQDLRNDILFLRVDIDEALRRYELLTEGETLPDALQKDLSDMATDINLITYTHSNMGGLVRKMYRELPLPVNLDEKKKQKQNQLRLFQDSYSLHEVKCVEVINLLKHKLKRFNRKSILVRVATEDVESESSIRLVLNQRLQLIEQHEGQLKQQMDTIRYYLSNPDKIPEELRALIATQGSEPRQ